MRGRALEAFGLDDDVDSGEYTGILDSDVKAVRHHSKNALGLNSIDDASKFSGAKRNCFRSDDSVAPWSRVSDTVKKEETSVFTRRILRSAPRNKMLP